MNRIILYYCVFYLTSFVPDAQKVLYLDLKSIKGSRIDYGPGILTHFSHLDDGATNMSCYVILEGDLPTRELIDTAIREMGDVVGQTGYGSMMDLIDMEDRVIHGMYKIISDEIHRYFYEDTDAVSIVYRGKCFTLNFSNIHDAKKFIDTLPESVKFIDKATYELLKK